MSNTQFAFLQRSRVPDRDELQKSIDQLGFNLKLDPDFTPFEDEGFLPFTLDGKEGPGYEVSYEDAEDVVDGDSGMERIASGRDFCISMVWRSSFKDLACVMIVSCALANDFDAVISYEGNEPEGLTELLESTKKIVAESANKK